MPECEGWNQTPGAAAETILPRGSPISGSLEFHGSSTSGCQRPPVSEWSIRSLAHTTYAPNSSHPHHSQGSGTLMQRPGRMWAADSGTKSVQGRNHLRTQVVNGACATREHACHPYTKGTRGQACY